MIARFTSQFRQQIFMTFISRQHIPNQSAWRNVSLNLLFKYTGWQKKSCSSLRMDSAFKKCEKVWGWTDITQSLNLVFNTECFVTSAVWNMPGIYSGRSVYLQTLTIIFRNTCQLFMNRYCHRVNGYESLVLTIENMITAALW